MSTSSLPIESEARPSFFERLEARVSSCNSLLCIGLDPHQGHLPSPTATDALQFCLDIIEKTHIFAAAYKPNSAFFEQFGSDGMVVLNKVISAIPTDIPIILDCKRGDIDTTAQAYAISSYDIYNATSVTLSPYMGYDSISPFISGKYNNKGAFVLCRTSNKSAKDFQELTIHDNNGPTLLYERIASKCMEWNQNSVNNGNKECIGLVVGATDTVALKQVRSIASTVWILCPGVGAQGGDAPTVCNAGLRIDGSGLLVSVSRGISGASDKSKAAELLRDEINECRKLFLQEQTSTNNKNTGYIEQYQYDFIKFALNKKVLQFGSFTLKSGRISPYFFNAGLFCSGGSIKELSICYAKAIRKHGVEFDVIFGPAYKGIPLATAIATAWYDLYNESKDICYNRKEVKDHGEGGMLVGATISNRKVLIVDDVITAGTAIRECVDILNSHQAIIVGVAVSLDRQEKANDACNESAIQMVEKDFHFPVISIVRLNHLITYVTQSGDKDVMKYLDVIIQYRQTYGVEY